MSPTGHLSVGFAAKKYAPQIPIFIFLIAAYAIDLIYFIFLALGMDIYEYNPWSHSLLMVIFWSLCAALLVNLFYKTPKGGIMVGLVVFSHWVLDFIVWDNLLIYFEDTARIGLGLYDKIGFNLSKVALDSASILASAIELSMLSVGLGIYFLYLKKTRRNKNTVA